LQILTSFHSDRIARIELLNSTLHEIRAANDAGASPPYAHTFVIYNFPDRDCSAESSAGELLIEEDGLNRYKTEYIDPIVELLNEFHDIRSIIAYGKLLRPGKIFRLCANFDQSPMVWPT
jgi:cellulose 1,4-beta-cellobiosidase